MSGKIGNVNYNKYGSKMVVEEYKNWDDVWIRFIESDNLVHTNYYQFKTGSVKNPFDPAVCGVGYIGEGKYKVRIDGKLTKQYKTWNSMFTRCYYEKELKKHPTYEDAIVCKEWHNFQSFAKWFDENYYEVNGEAMNLDKDILCKGNKVYSPSTCVLVPKPINLLFTKGDSRRGDLPIGVHWNKRDRKYVSQCSNKGSSVNLGYYDSSEEAFDSYKTYKEKLIKEIANEYRDRIPIKLYEALMKYEVDIND